MEERSIGRSLLQAPPQPSVKPPVTFDNIAGQPCIMLWAENLIVANEKESLDLGPGAFNGSASLNGSTCNQTVSRSEEKKNVSSFTNQMCLTFILGIEE